MTALAPTLTDRFQERAVAEPAAPALAWKGTVLSYGELGELIAGAAAALGDLGLPAGAPVGIKAAKSPQAIALILACLGERRPFVLPSTELADETLGKLFWQADCAAVLALQAGDGGLQLAASDVPASDEERPPTVDSAGEAAFMLTTSGSTGLPKIVPLAAGGIDRFTDWAAGQFEIGPGTTVLNFAPLNFDLCLLDIWTTLKHGGCVALVEQGLAATNGRHLAGLLTDHEVNVVQGVPMLYRLLIDATAEGGSFPAVRHVLATGDKISTGALAELPGRFPNARFFNVYGCTETNDSTMHELDLSGDPPKVVPIGRPLPDVIALVVAEDGGFLEGPGTGELVVWTPFQTEGYLLESLNEGKFVTYDDPELDGGRRFYRSGDIVRRHEDGTMTLVGRSDFYVKVRGVRVSTQVVEQGIMEHPDVVEVAVLPLPDDIAGTVLHAVVRAAEGGGLNGLKLRQHCATHLSRIEIPGSIEFVTDPLPRTSTGKVDRKRIVPKRGGGNR